MQMEKNMVIRWHSEHQPKMTVKEKNDVTYLAWQKIEELNMVRHGFSTRLGGVSEGVFFSMNLSYIRGDQKEAVDENFRRIAAAIGFEIESIVMAEQTHTTNVVTVTEKDRGRGLEGKESWTDVDGLITNLPGLTLATFYADCVPLYFVDTVHRAIGLSHSGWRGTVGKIGQKTIEAMNREYGTTPQDLLVAIGPSICPDCYEVSGDVIEEFQQNFDRKHWDNLFCAKSNGKYQLNLWKANEIIFLEAGIPQKNICLPNLCTCCNPEFLFSHRASKGKRGNLAAFLQLK